MDSTRADFVAAHLHALAYAARKFAGEPVRFVDEVRAYFDVSIVKGDEQRYREAHALLDDALAVAARWPTACTPTAPPTRLRRSGSAIASAASVGAASGVRHLSHTYHWPEPAALVPASERQTTHHPQSAASQLSLKGGHPGPIRAERHMGLVGQSGTGMLRWVRSAGR